MSPEEEILLDLVRGFKPDLENELDWDYLVELLKVHKLVPLFLEKVFREQLPPKTYEDLIKFKFYTRSITTELLNNYNTLSEILTKYNIGFFPIKGIKKVINGELDRHMDDVDILFDEHKVDDVVRHLQEGGFIYHPNKSKENIYHELFFTHKKNKRLFYELKTKLDKSLPINYAFLKEEKQKEELMLCFDIHHAIFNHPFHRLRWIYEIKKELPKHNIRSLIKVAEKYNIRSSIIVCLIILKKVFKANIKLPALKEQDLSRAGFVMSLHNFATPLTPKQAYEFDRLVRVCLSNDKKQKKSNLKDAFFPKRAETKVKSNLSLWTVYVLNVIGRTFSLKKMYKAYSI